jgi:hypothetical protein
MDSILINCTFLLVCIYQTSRHPTLLIAHCHTRNTRAQASLKQINREKVINILQVSR